MPPRRQRRGLRGQPGWRLQWTVRGKSAAAPEAEHGASSRARLEGEQLQQHEQQLLLHLIVQGLRVQGIEVALPDEWRWRASVGGRSSVGRVKQSIVRSSYGKRPRSRGDQAYRPLTSLWRHAGLPPPPLTPTFHAFRQKDIQIPCQCCMYSLFRQIVQSFILSTIPACHREEQAHLSLSRAPCLMMASMPTPWKADWLRSTPFSIHRLRHRARGSFFGAIASLQLCSL